MLEYLDWSPPKRCSTWTGPPVLQKVETKQESEIRSNVAQGRNFLREGLKKTGKKRSGHFLTQNFIPVTRAPNVMRSPDQVDMGRREVTAEDGTSIVHIVTLTHVLA